MYSSIPACLYPLPTVGLQGKADRQNNFIIKKRKEINKKKTEHPKGKQNFKTREAPFAQLIMTTQDPNAQVESLQGASAVHDASKRKHEMGILMSPCEGRGTRRHDLVLGDRCKMREGGLYLHKLLAYSGNVQGLVLGKFR